MNIFKALSNFFAGGSIATTPTPLWSKVFRLEMRDAKTGEVLTVTAGGNNKPYVDVHEGDHVLLTINEEIVIRFTPMESL